MADLQVLYGNILVFVFAVKVIIVGLEVVEISLSFIDAKSFQ